MTKLPASEIGAVRARDQQSLGLTRVRYERVSITARQRDQHGTHVSSVEPARKIRHATRVGLVRLMCKTNAASTARDINAANVQSARQAREIGTTRRRDDFGVYAKSLRPS